MPSHIFTRVGAWEESVATNRRSADGREEGQRARRGLSRADYMVYALPAARPRRRGAREIDEAMKVTGHHRRFVAGPYAIAAMPARYALERGDWREAAKLRADADASIRSPTRSRTSRARSARRAAATSPPREQEAEQLARAAQGAEGREEHVLGDRGRGAAARRRRRGSRSRRGKRGRGAQAHARRRRPRGPEREAHRHAGPHRCPRASCSATCCSS